MNNFRQLTKVLLCSKQGAAMPSMSSSPNPRALPWMGPAPHTQLSSDARPTSQTCCLSCRGRGYAMNIPLNDGIDDESYEQLFKPIMCKVVEVYKPEVIVFQSGRYMFAFVALQLGSGSMLPHTGRMLCPETALPTPCSLLAQARGVSQAAPSAVRRQDAEAQSRLSPHEGPGG